MRQSIPDALIASLQRDRPLSAGDRILVAVSGGPDSVALLHALRFLLPPGVVLGAAHLDHAVRADSDRDARFVADLCRDWSIPLLAERLPPWERSPSEERLRQARYAFLEHSAESWGAGTVALAHQADDQAETVLMHLLRGSGLDGAVGMVPSRRLYWRPLLEVPRSEIGRYLQVHALPFREDPTNRDPRYLRNRIRWEILPCLEDVNPRIRQSLTRFSRHVREERDLLDRLLLPRWAGRIRATPEGLAVEVERWGEAERGRIARRLLGLLGLPVGGREIALLAAGLGPGGDDASESPGGDDASPFGDSRGSSASPGGDGEPRRVGALWIRRRGDVLHLGRADRPLRIRLPLPGEVELPAAGWWVGAAPAPPPGEHEAWVTGRLPGVPLTIRFWEPGDRLELPGGGHRKLQDLFTDRKVPRGQRTLLPCVVQGPRVLYVASLRGAPRPKPQEPAVWIWARRIQRPYTH